MKSSTAATLGSYTTEGLVQEPGVDTSDTHMQYLLAKRARERAQVLATTGSGSATYESSATSEVSAVIDTLKLLQDIRALFRQASHEDFEFGMESEFIRGLESRVARHGVRAIQAIAHIILTGKAEDRVAAESLRWLGGIQHEESHLLRLRLLEESLHFQSSWVRDGAALGLDVLNDRNAIPALKAAIAQEPLKGLRRDMERVVQRLEHTL